MPDHQCSYHRSVYCLLLLLAVIIASIIGPATSLADADDPFSRLLEQRMPDLLAKYGVPGSVIAYIKVAKLSGRMATGWPTSKETRPCSRTCCSSTAPTARR